MAVLEELSGFRLSPHQRDLWAWQESGPFCHARCRLLLEGPLDVERLRQALGRVVARHDALRTTFQTPAWMRLPVQVVQEETGAGLPRLEPGGGPGSAAPFDLARGPVARFSLASRSAREHVLEIALPAVCADLWTLRMLAGEVRRAYAGGLEERSGDDLRYGEYAEWQNALLDDEESEEGRELWRRFGALPPVRLPLEEPSPAGAFDPRRVVVEPEAEVAAGLERLAAGQGLPLAEVLLACWQLLLWRAGGPAKGVVRFLCDGRDLEEVRGVAGLVAKHLPVAVDFAADLTLPELWREAADAVRRARPWHDCFTEELAGAVDGRPAHPVLFELDEWEAPREAHGVRFSLLERSVRTGPHKLRLLAIRSERGLRCEIHHDAATVPPRAALQLAGWLDALLRSVVRDPGARAAEVDLLSESARHQVLQEWGPGPAEPAAFLSFQDRVARRAALQPQVPAVVCGDESLTFRELDDRAGRLARRLRALGVGPETLVGVCLERSVDLVVAILGVLKAGGAYVPLDPGQPEARLAAMLEDARPLAVLTRPGLEERLARLGPRAVRVGEGADLPETGEGGAPLPDHLAYVIYTSGSTGRPKGVMIRHGALAHLADALRSALRLGAPPLRVGLNAPVAFDASVKQLLQLAEGHTLCLVPEEARADGPALLSFLAAQELDVLDCTPAQARLLLAAGLAGLPAGAAPRLLVGGEAIDRSLWAELAAAGSPEVFNVYGPTECTVDTTVCRLRSHPEGPTLGRPLPNVRVHLLDADLRPVPPGLPGELCIGGAGLARGYLRAADLTARKFVPDPFGAAGERLYRSGDLARHLPGGEIEFLGRIDHQVKVRGVRVEAGEIEAALAEHPGVREASVLLRAVGEHDSRLVAYWTAAARPAPAPGELREHLRRRLPEPMVPALFVELPALPLTRNGKVDRRALPEPEAVLAEERPLVAPRTPAEQMLAEIWCEVLDLDRVGADDDFFDLGGHSLLATQMISRVRRTFRTELPLRALFDAPTLAALAGEIERTLRAGRGLDVPPVEPGAGGAPPLSFAQQRLWFLDQLQPGNPFYNVPGAFRFAGRLDRAALARTLGEVARRHEVLRTVFPSRDGEPRAVVLPAAPPPLPLVDLSALPAAERAATVDRLATAEARHAFDLSRGPLFRVVLLRLGPEEHAALFTMHHIVGDGWSTGLLIREVAALYQAFAAGRPSPLTELPVQYGDFAAWQRRWLQGAALADQLDAWRRRLDGAPPLLDLPTDRPRPPMPTFRGDVERLVLPAGLAAAVRTLCRREGVTLFMALLASFQALLARYAGQEDVSVGTPIAGRNRLETEGLIGLFVNTLVLRSDLSGDPPFRELLRRVRESALEAHAHQDLPFEKLVEALQPERSLSYMPLFQVWFSVLNVPSEDLRLPGLEIRPLATSGGTSKFDLNLTLQERGQRLEGALEYSTDLFTAASMRRLLEHWQTLLAAAAEAPETALRGLPLLTAAERRALLGVEGPAAAPAPAGETVAGLFAAAVERHAAAVALSGDEGSLTYREFDRRANHVAHRLLALGAGPGERVGICLEHSFAAVTALLGVLKTGAAYVPIDPGHPARQADLMIADAGVRLLLTQESLEERLRRDGLTLLRVEEGEADPPEALVMPEAVAYVIYTSGSTGTPKGVEISHAALCNYVAWACQAYVRGESLTFPLFSSLSFDLTVTSVFPPLVTGNRIAVYRDTGGDPLVLRVVEDDRADVVKLTPSHLALLKDRDLRGSRIRRLVVGGEALTAELARHVAASFGGGVEILNEYGPTEATVGCMLHRYDPAVDRRTAVPIGAAAPGTRIYVLDAELAPVAENVTGEICIGGCGLARGYLGRPDLTAERFLPDPFGDGRIYRTGDLARWIPGGGLEFVGRRDGQVKYHGYRIELEGIRCLLNEHPGVRDSVVALSRDAAGEDVLVAWYVARQPLPAGELRAFLAERMLAAMVPNLFIHLRRLPLTLNGKINYAALPSAREAGGQVPRSFVAPRTPIEEVLAGIWSQVLGAGRVGVTESFFELGGHSLLATRVTSRVRELFGVELPLRSLFEAPTVAGLAERVDLLRREGGTAGAPPLRRTDRDRPLPLSFAQERLWILDRLEPGSTAYNFGFAARLEGELDRGALERACQEVFRRHEILRTTFPLAGGVPVQRVAEHVPRPLPSVDLQGLPEELRGTEADRLAGALARRPFDLARGPMVRLALVVLDRAGHLLAMSLHHILGDAWSNEILAREIASLYAAFAEGRPSPLPELPLQVADFAAWERDWLRGETLASHLAWWKSRLGGDLPRVELLPDRPRPQSPTHRAGRVAHPLPDGLAAALRQLAQEAGATLFMTVLAAFQALLARFTGATDFTLGTPVTRRGRVELEGLVGFFVNTAVVRADVGGDPGFRDLLARVRDDLLAADLYGDLPFDRLVEELQPDRSTGRNPLFQILFAFQNAPAGETRLPGLRMVPLEIPSGTVKFDLGLAVQELGQGGLTLAADFDRDLFDRTTVARLLGHFEALLQQAVAAPGRRISELASLGDVERQLLLEWNDTATSVSLGRTIAEAFEAQAARAPEAVALALGDLALTYGELDRRANRLARFLRRSGVEREELVGICLDRSLEMVVAMLAVLKAGAAYLPLDPNLPRERFALIAGDAGARRMIGERRRAGHLTGEAGIALIDLAEAAAAVGRESAGRPPLEAGPESLAYVMYTSGSTGRPKGVAIPQRGVLRLVLETSYAPDLAEETLLQFSPISFDASTLEIWGALLHGGRLAIYPPREATLAELGEVLAEQAVSFPVLTAGLFHQIAEHQPQTLAPVRQVSVGGDVVSPWHVRKFLADMPGISVFHAYGPTETTTIAAACVLRSAAEVEGALSIGRPIADTEVYVLDRLFRPVPVGVAGELCIGGEGLARGYLGDPAHTADRFIPSGGGGRGARLYRTGDLARFLADGRLEFLGRRDHQVKVRGFRIEPAEVEATLAEHPAVRHVVVVARREAASGDRRLVAYLVAEPGHAPAVRELREHARQRLPEHMVPSAFMILDAFPLTEYGKVDRRALPAPSSQRPELGALVRPRTAVEEILCGIWEQVLGLAEVGVEDHFFELGGSSLLAIQVISRVREAFGEDVPLRALFESPTIAGLAAAVELSRRRGGLPPIAPVPRDGDMPLSFAQQRLWFIHQLDPAGAAYNMPLALRLEGPLHPAALAGSLREVIRRHEALRTVFAETGSGPVQRILPSREFQLPVCDLSGLAAGARGAELLRLAREESLRPFALDRGPLLRTVLLRLDGEEHALLLTLHHIVGDGWSMQLLMREMVILYEALAGGRPSPLEELAVQYADFAVSQRRSLDGERGERLAAYWQRQLAGIPARFELPADRPRPAVPRAAGKTVRVELPGTLAGGLAALGRREGVTLFMGLVAALAALLYHRTGSDDVVLGTDVAGRDRTEIEPLIGFFVNQIVLRVRLDGDPSFREVLRRARETVLDGWTHHEMPFERLVEALRLERGAGMSPLFGVKLVLQRFPEAPRPPRGVTLTPLPYVNPTSKFDLLLNVVEDARGLTVAAEYDAELFEEATVAGLLRDLALVLGTGVEAPEARLGEILSRLPEPVRKVRSELLKTVRRKSVRL